MLGVIQNWITTMLCVGIFFTFIKMLVPSSKLSKYIYSLMGVVTIITLIVPFMKFLDEKKLEDAAKTVINSIDIDEKNNTDDVKTKEIIDNNLKNEFSKKIKNNIEKIFLENNIKVENINVIINEKYEIEKIVIKIDKDMENKLFNIDKIFKFIYENYNISNEKVSIEEY